MADKNIKRNRRSVPFSKEMSGFNFFEMKSNLNESQLNEVQTNLAINFPQICSKIDELVKKIRDIVADAPPELLLQRAYWTLLPLCASGEKKSEAEWTLDESLSIKPLFYLQDIIVSTLPAPEAKNDLDEESWNTLQSSIEELFLITSSAYQAAKFAHDKAGGAVHNQDIEEFRHKAQFYWCNVTGKRHDFHYIPFLTKFLTPHDEIIRELFGVGAESILKSLKSIADSLTFGLGEVLQTMLKQKETGIIDEEIFHKTFGLDLFDLEKISILPKDLLEELSWSPGEEKKFCEGKYAGWLLKEKPTSERPFVKIKGKYYCFNLHILFDNIYRVLEKIITTKKPQYRNKWNKYQKNTSEAFAIELFKKLLPNCKAYQSFYYYDQNNEKCESDGVVIYEDYLFVIEVKAGSFSKASPVKFQSYIESIEDLVESPVDQGKRLLALMEKGSVDIYDEKGSVIDNLAKDSFKKSIICSVTLDSLTEITAQIQHLKKVGIQIDQNFPTWSISLGDLMVYADIFDNPLHFLHFVKNRMEAFNSSLSLEDELDHLGLYFTLNNYVYCCSKDALGLPENSILNFNGYRIEIDRYFYDKLMGENPEPPSQKIPNELKTIVNLLSKKPIGNKRRVSEIILDYDSTQQHRLVDGIINALSRQMTLKRIQPLSVNIGVHKVVIFCWQKNFLERDQKLALEHSKTVLLLHDNEEILSLELIYENDILVDLDANFISRSQIKLEEAESLKSKVNFIRQQRIENYQNTKKLSVNDKCPCGSGVKYKKCCLTD